jgi:hypothetical protein
MVGVAGFEPATPASRTRCSTRLSHTPTWEGAYKGASGAPQGGRGGRRNSRIGPLHRRRLRAISHASRGGASPAVPAGEWCNGNTAVFGTVILGSSPSSPATSLIEPSPLSGRRRSPDFSPLNCNDAPTIRVVGGVLPSFREFNINLL